MTDISDEDIEKDIIISIPPRSTEIIKARIVSTRRGTPSKLDESDLAWNTSDTPPKK